MKDIAYFLEAAGEPEYAAEVLNAHNRLEAFADGLDKAALDCAIKAAEEAIKQRDELLADLAEVKRSAEFNFEQYQDVGRLLHEECEKTEKLLAALERFATWARGQHRAQSKGCHATFDMMMLRDEIDFAEAAIELHGEYARLNPVGVKGEQ